MAHALSADLRRRIVDAYARGEGTYGVLAARFRVGKASVSRFLRLYRQNGSLERRPRGGGNAAKISAELLLRLRELVAEDPKRSARELAQEWERRFGVAMSRSSMVRALSRAGLQGRNGPRERMTNPHSSLKANGQRHAVRPPALQRSSSFADEPAQMSPA